MRCGISGQCIPQKRAVSPAHGAKGRAESGKTSQASPAKSPSPSPPAVTPQIKAAAEGPGLLPPDTRFSSHQGTCQPVFQFIHRIWPLLKRCVSSSTGCHVGITLPESFVVPQASASPLASSSSPGRYLPEDGQTQPYKEQRLRCWIFNLLG